MADYRPDCCGGFPNCKPDCYTISNKSVKSKKESTTLDALYAKYGELIALAERTSHNTRIDYKHKAEGVLMAIRIIEDVK